MAAGAAGGAAAAMIQAARASGVIVRVEPGAFDTIVRKVEAPLVVASQGGVFRKYYDYLVSYKGLAFYTRSQQPLTLPPGAEIVAASRIWVPGA